MLDTRVFSIREDRKHRPDTPDATHDFYVMEAVDWVNIIPVTASDEIVFIAHYRHGTDEVRLEVPGGMVDPEDPDPMYAAVREMREETGYTSDDVVELGVVHPNPAIQTNRCHTFLARGAYREGEPRPDDTEDIEVVLCPRAEVPELFTDGRITHSLVVSAFFWLSRYEQQDR